MIEQPSRESSPRGLPAEFAGRLAERRGSFAIGVQGAVAEFHWVDGDEAMPGEGPLSLATSRGAIRIHALDGVRTHRTRPPADSPAHRASDGAPLVCWLPARQARLDSPAGLSELGPDADAVRAGERSWPLFDLGLRLGHVRACVRSADEALLAVLRAHAGEDVLAPGSPVMAAIKKHSPQRVFVSAIARIEVYQAIPSRARGERTPHGPHTHLLPKLLGRPDPALAALPGDARAVLSVYPAD